MLVVLAWLDGVAVSLGTRCVAERPGFLLVASDLIRGSLHSTTGPRVIIELLTNSRCLVEAVRKSLIGHEAGIPTQTGALTGRPSGGSFQPALRHAAMSGVEPRKRGAGHLKQAGNTARNCTQNS